MPTCDCGIRQRKRTWKHMSGWARKQWYRENQNRAFYGKKPLPKPG